MYDQFEKWKEENHSTEIPEDFRKFFEEKFENHDEDYFNLMEEISYDLYLLEKTVRECIS